MKGDFLIDGTSAYDTYGVFVVQGSLADIISVPSFKSLETVEWLEDDGVDVDLSSPVLNSKTISITFGFRNFGGLEDFYSDLKSAHAHTFNFLDIARTVSLRMLSNSSLSSLIRMGVATLSFVQDVVTIPSASPYSIGQTRVTQRGYKLDNVDMSQYGCWILDGSLQSYRRSAAVKENLTISSKAVEGQTYYGQTDGVKQRGKDITLHILINARNLTEFNRCYNALFYALTQPNEREFIFAAGGFNKCYYKSSKCERLEVCKSGTVWCELSLAISYIGVVSDAPYLEISPTTIWTNPWGTNDVLSNTNWNIN